MTSFQYIPRLQRHRIAKNVDTRAQSYLHKASPTRFGAVKLGCCAIVEGEADSEVTDAIRQYQAFVGKPHLYGLCWGMKSERCGMLNLQGG